MLPADAGRVLGCIAKQERQALGPLLNTNVRAHATSALLLKTMQANGPHRATYVKLKRGFSLWSKMLPLKKRLQMLLEENMDVALVGMRGLAEPSSAEVAALCALVSLTAFPPLSSAVLEATQVPLSQLVERGSLTADTKDPSNARIISAIWTATVNHVLLRPPSRSSDPHAQPSTTTIERMHALVDLAQSGGFGDAEVRELWKCAPPHRVPGCAEALTASVGYVRAAARGGAGHVNHAAQLPAPGSSDRATSVTALHRRGSVGAGTFGDASHAVYPEGGKR
jgi:hypothetical protein